jgi:hypothetical protein
METIPQEEKSDEALMDCEERERLNTIYLHALNRHSEVKRHIADPRSEEGMEATNETREDCYAALATLNAHKAEHGC